MNREEFIHWLVNNNWWDSDYYYFFTDKKLFLKDNSDFNDANIMACFKRPRNCGVDLASPFKVEFSNGELTANINGIGGRVEILSYKFRIHDSNGNLIEISQYMTL